MAILLLVLWRVREDPCAIHVRARAASAHAKDTDRRARVIAHANGLVGASVQSETQGAAGPTDWRVTEFPCD
jgi:hypothetical protein